MMKMACLVWFLACAFGMRAEASGNDDAVALVRGGQPCAVVIIAEEPGDKSRGVIAHSTEESAVELIKVVKAISGAELPLERVNVDRVVEVANEVRSRGLTPVLLGSAALQGAVSFSGKSKEAFDDPSGFVLRVGRNGLEVAGSTANGVAYGVYELLEQVGVRWFFPGRLGTVIPSAPTLKLAQQETASRPSIAARHFQLQGAADWIKHQRAGGPVFPSAHGIPLGKGISVANHPAWFALVGGKRSRSQICVSNPEVVKRTVEQTLEYFRKNPLQPWIGMGPNDGGGFCECESCLALDSEDRDPFSGGGSVTDRYIWFFNQVLDGIKDEFPDKKLAFYVYHSYMRPPVKTKPNPRIVPAIAPVGLCRIHGMHNPICPERGYLRDLIMEWSKLLPEVYERGYWFNLADPGMLFVQTLRLRDEIPYYARQGAKGFRTECQGSWAAEGPSLYVAGRLLWNAEADPDAIVGDFCEKLFGPAAKPMQAYFTFLDHRLRDVDHHSGSAFNLTQIYPPEVLSLAKTLLEKAEQRSRQSPYKERVEIFRLGFDYTEAFARMIAAQNRHDWKEAYAQLLTMDAVRERLINYDTPMISKTFSENYLKRFFRLPVEQGYARTHLRGRMIAPLADQWQFQIDPQEVGEALRYMNPASIGANWQVLSPSKMTWSDVGLRYYKGLAWYRQGVNLPKNAGGKRVFLWFGGVDESARVWVNGRLAGTSPISAFTPFEVDVTDIIVPGSENNVVICVANQRVDELGMGGITAPAFFYEPAEGAAAVLENIQPLRETFP